MLSEYKIKNSRYLLRYFCSLKYYYATKSSIWDIVLFVKHIQFSGKYKYGKLMKTIPYFTKQINLLQTAQELNKSFSKQTRYKINRANREDIKFNIYTLDSKEKIDNYLRYHNDFLKSKGLLFRLSKREIYALLDNYVVSYASYKGETLVMHCSFVDPEQQTVYVHHSASHFRTLNEENIEIDRNLISYANNFLHYQDMLHFKSLGMNTYDLGGYGVDTDDKSILAINQFKDGFRGKLIQQNHYESYLFYFASTCYRILKPCIIKEKIIEIQHSLISSKKVGMDFHLDFLTYAKKILQISKDRSSEIKLSSKTKVFLKHKENRR